MTAREVLGSDQNNQYAAPGQVLSCDVGDDRSLGALPWGIHALGKTQRTGDILVKAVDSAACDPHDQLLRDS